MENISAQKNVQIQQFSNIFNLCRLIIEKNLARSYHLIAVIDTYGVVPFLMLSKVGIIVASVYEEYSSYMTVLHNNSKVLATGFEICGTELIISIVNKFFATTFEGGRHYARIDMLKLENTAGKTQ